MFGFGKEKKEETPMGVSITPKDAVVEIPVKDYHPMVKRMADCMQAKLRMRLERYPACPDGREHWIGAKSLKYLQKHFSNEIIEFNNEFLKMQENVYNLKDVDNVKELVYEAADVCNLMAMMLDKLNDVLNQPTNQAIRDEWQKPIDWKPEENVK